jgi:transcriptional regulator with XRE-family HTH domain
MQRPPFGDVLRRFRVQRMYSQAELAERSGLREKSISALETGLRSRPHFSTLRALADALCLDETERALLLAATGQTGIERRRPYEGGWPGVEPASERRERAAQAV